MCNKLVSNWETSCNVFPDQQVNYKFKKNCNQIEDIIKVSQYIICSSIYSGKKGFKKLCVRHTTKPQEGWVSSSSVETLLFYIILVENNMKQLNITINIMLAL